jgi:hypothetical protein
MKPVYFVPLIALSLLLSFMGSIYFYSQYLSNLYYSISSISFWVSISAILILTYLKRPFLYVVRRFREKISLLTFFSYLLTHYLIYGFLLQRIFQVVYGVSFNLPLPIISSTPFYPPNIINILLGVVFNPYISFYLPYNVIISLSPFSLTSGLLTTILVTSNVISVKNLYFIKRVRALILAPIIGLIGAGTCCITIPSLLIAYITPIPAILVALPLSLTTLSIIYITLPMITILALKLNFDAVYNSIPKSFRIEKW